MRSHHDSCTGRIDFKSFATPSWKVQNDNNTNEWRISAWYRPRCSCFSRVRCNYSLICWQASTSTARVCTNYCTYASRSSGREKKGALEIIISTLLIAVIIRLTSPAEEVKEMMKINLFGCSVVSRTGKRNSVQ